MRRNKKGKGKGGIEKGLGGRTGRKRREGGARKTGGEWHGEIEGSRENEAVTERT